MNRTAIHKVRTIVDFQTSILCYQSNSHEANEIDVVQPLIKGPLRGVLASPFFLYHLLNSQRFNFEAKLTHEVGAADDPKAPMQPHTGKQRTKKFRPATEQDVMGRTP